MFAYSMAGAAPVPAVSKDSDFVSCSALSEALSPCEAACHPPPSELTHGHSMVDSLPLPAIVHCASFLDHVSLTRLAFTCKRLLPVGLSDQLWKPVCVRLAGAPDGAADKGVDVCWRSRIYAWKRAAEYKKALTYGRVGRIAPPPRIVRYCLALRMGDDGIYPEGTAASPRAVAACAGGAGAAASGSGLSAGAGGETRWLMASRPAASSASGAAAGTDAVVEAVCSRQGTASWSALGRA